MISQALKKVRDSILHDPYFEPIIKAHFNTLYAHISDSWEDVSKVYRRKPDIGLTLGVLKTLYLLNSWALRSTNAAVRKKQESSESANLVYDPDTTREFAITPEENDFVLAPDEAQGAFDDCAIPVVSDSSWQYDLIDELSESRGFMNFEDVKGDIIEAVITFFKLCECRNMVALGLWVSENGEYHEQREKADPHSDFWAIVSPYPNNMIKRHYDRINKGLHVRSIIPTYEDSTEIEDIERLLFAQLEAHDPHSLVDFGIDMWSALHPRKKLEKGIKNPFLVYDPDSCLPYDIDIAAIKAALRQKARSKSGQAALQALFASWGASRETIAALSPNLAICGIHKHTQRRPNGETTAKTEKRVAVMAASPKGRETIRKGGVRKDVTIIRTDSELTPSQEIKRSRGRPRKTPKRGRPKKVVG